jgi:hypothetical protein
MYIKLQHTSDNFQDHSKARFPKNTTPHVPTSAYPIGFSFVALIWYTDYLEDLRLLNVLFVLSLSLSILIPTLSFVTTVIRLVKSRSTDQ